MLPTFPTATSAASGYARWWRPNKLYAKACGALEVISFARRRFLAAHGLLRRRTSGRRSRWPLTVVATSPSEKRCRASGCDAHPKPIVGHANALLLLAAVRASSSPNHPGDVGRNPPKSRRQSGMLGLERHRLVIETHNQPESTTTTWHRFEGTANA